MQTGGLWYKAAVAGAQVREEESLDQVEGGGGRTREKHGFKREGLQVDVGVWW